MAKENMDEYLTELKQEAEEAMAVIDDLRKHHDSQLAAYDNQILLLIKQKKIEKAKLDAKMTGLKVEVDKKRDTYNQIASTMESPSRHLLLDSATISTPVLSPGPNKLIVGASGFQSSSGTTSSEQDEDEYYPTKKAFASSSKLTSRAIPKAAIGSNAPQGHQVDLDEYPILVQHPRDRQTWIQVRCPVCHGNTRCDGIYFKGVMGVKRHMRLAHSDICEVSTKAKLFGAFGVENIIERRFTLAELDDMKSGKIPAPIPVIVSSNVAEDMQDESAAGNTIEAFMAFDQFPTIVRRADGVWVELRCPICNANCVDDKYMRGVIAFHQHLELSHDQTAPDDKPQAEWVVSTCEVRELNEYELMGLMDGRDGVIPPLKVSAASSLSGVEVPLIENSLITPFGPNSRSIPKRSGTVIEEDTEEEDHDPTKHTKRARREMTVSAAVIRSSIRTANHYSEHEPSSPTIQERESINIEIVPPTPRFAGTSNWDMYCPCTLSSHTCKKVNCTKKKICVKADHSRGCPSDITHAVAPICMGLVGGNCDGVGCEFAHDKLEERTKILEEHSCEDH